jgi:lipid-binding SYLF domain-containing protein
VSLGLSVLVLVLGLLAAPAARAASDQEVKVEEVIEVLEALSRIPEKRIPSALLRNAEGIAVIPSVLKVGLVIGGRYGKGVISVRREDGHWSDPAFVSIRGGSVGWQIGAQSTDVILVFKSRRGIEGLIDGKFTLGADASVAAGPVGRQAAAATDAQLAAEIYSYSRSRGLFAGVSLDGAVLQMENDDNALYYRSFEITPERIFAGRNAQTPSSASRLRDVLVRYQGDGR